MVGFQERTLRHLGLRDHPALSSYAAFERVAKATKRYQAYAQQIRTFHRFHTNTLYVAYACVAARPALGMAHDERNTGIGTILYAACAHATAAMNLPFFSSGIQEDEAAILWSRLAGRGWTTAHTVTLSRSPLCVRHRLRLHADRIPSSVFLSTLANAPADA